MRFVFNVDEFLPALQAVTQVINAKNSMPILDNVVIEVQDAKVVRLTGSDTETQLTVPAPLVDADERGALCVNAVRFVQILSRLKGRNLELTTHDNMTLCGTYDGGTFDMTYEDAKEYPFLEFNGDVRTYVVPGAILADGIKNTLFATSNDEIRPVMMGVYFDFLHDYGLTCVGTDGRCLVKHTDNRLDVGESASFILPQKPAKVLRSVLAMSPDTNASVAFNDKNVTIEDAAFSMRCRLIEGRYPNYNSVIPTVHKIEALVVREELIDALSRISVFTPMSELVSLEFLADGICRVACQDVDFSLSAKETIKCAFNGACGDIKIGFKYSVLDALLRNLTSKEVVFSMSEPNRAAVVTPMPDPVEGVHTLSLIMPMLID